MMEERIIRVRRRNGACLAVAESGREFLYPLAMEEVFPLREGQTADLDGMETALRAHARPYALARLAQLQAGREHTQRELTEALRRQGYPEDCAREAVAEMCAAGFAGDGRYCESLIRSRSRKEGREKLAWKMRLRGVEEETAREALDALLSPEEEEKAALLQAQKLRARGTEDKKIFMSLSRKGYSREICLRALRKSGEEAL